LAERSLLFSGDDLAPAARLRISGLPGHVRDVPEALKSHRTYKANLLKSANHIAGSLFALSSEADQRSGQSNTLLKLLVRARLCPLIHETYPLDFALLDMPNATDLGTCFERLLGLIVARVGSLELPPRSETILRRHLIVRLLDEIDFFTDSQGAVKIERRALVRCMARFSELDRTPITSGESRAADRAAAIFARIAVSRPPSVNIELVLLAVTVFPCIDEARFKVILARSKNPDLFALMMFVMEWLPKREQKALVFTEEEMKSVRGFVYVANKFLTELNR
jgi:hypothetical protein